jgi:hypothetical protein
MSGWLQSQRRLSTCVEAGWLSIYWFTKIETSSSRRIEPESPCTELSASSKYCGHCWTG